tara:strand:- start:182 stop:643 length:462 start_codon:yes stop_codon:yes gene_type:complete
MNTLSTNFRGFDPFFIGFDRMFNQLEKVDSWSNKSSPGFPPYDLVQNGDNYHINMAVAGFSEDDLSVELKESALTISGEIKDDDKVKYLHKGIAARKFKREFTLAETVEVKNVKLANGVLTIDLENVIPEDKKPKKFAINSGGIDTKKTLLTE